MYEFVHTAPESRSTLNRMALTAERMRYSGIIIRNHSNYELLDEWVSEFGVDVVGGVEVRADSVEQLHGLVRKYRDKVDVVCVHGGEEDINRGAVEMDEVDVLCHPMKGRGRGVNHVTAATARENDVVLEFNLSKVLRESGGERVRALQDLRFLRKLVRKYGTPFIISGDPYTHQDLRAPREMKALLELIGFREGEINTGIGETPSTLSKNDYDVWVVE